MIQKFRGMLLFVILCVFLSVPAFARNISVSLDGNSLPLSAPAIVKNDRVLVPMRSIMEALGYTVVWDNKNRTIEATKGSTTLFLTLDQSVALVNQTPVVLDAAALLSENTTMVPLRFVAEYSGATVEWTAASNTIVISTEKKSPASLTDSVVYIQTNKIQGSGIVLSKDGLISTNYHVVEGASMLQLVFADSSVYQGKVTVVGLDPQRDIALLKIERNDLIPAEVETAYKKGDAVSSVGAPNGKRNTIAEGTINDFNEDILSSSAFIDHGSSGGGLFNSKGKVIGMTSSYSDHQYFAIPMNHILKVPKTLSIPIKQMKYYDYTPTPPKNMRSWIADGYANVTWSPVYNADHYYVYIAYSKSGKYTKLYNKALSDEIWYWGFPQCFGISTANHSAVYIKVSTVHNGIETETTPPMEIRMQ